MKINEGYYDEDLPHRINHSRGYQWEMVEKHNQLAASAKTKEEREMHANKAEQHKKKYRELNMNESVKRTDKGFVSQPGIYSEHKFRSLSRFKKAAEASGHTVKYEKYDETYHAYDKDGMHKGSYGGDNSGSAGWLWHTGAITMNESVTKPKSIFDDESDSATKQYSYHHLTPIYSHKVGKKSHDLHQVPGGGFYHTVHKGMELQQDTFLGIDKDAAKKQYANRVDGAFKKHATTLGESIIEKIMSDDVDSATILFESQMHKAATKATQEHYKKDISKQLNVGS